MSRQSGGRAQYAALAALLALPASHQAKCTWDSIQYLLHSTEQARAPFETAWLGPRVVQVREEAESAGLRTGDRVLTILGRAFTGGAILTRPIALARPGQTFEVTAERPGGAATEELTLEIRLAPRTREPLDASDWALGLVFLATPLFCLLLGFAVVGLRPRDPRAWLLLLLMLSFSQLSSADANPAGWGDGIRPVGIAYRMLTSQTWSLWMLLFGLYFPERLPLDGRHPWIKWLFIVPLGSNAVLMATIALLAARDFGAASVVYRVLAPLGNLPLFLGMTAIGTFFASVGWRAGTTTSSDARRRLQLLLWGSQVSLSPIFVVILTGLALRQRPFAFFPSVYAIPAFLMLFLFPLTLAYVIVVHRALDVRVVVRQGLQYALARNGIRVLQILVSAGVMLVAVTLATDPGANRPRRISAIAYGVMFVALARRAADRVRAWTDRRFFREAYSAEQILTELSEQVRTMVETRPLLATVADRIAASLHVPRIATFLRQDGSYVPAHAVGYDVAPDVAFAEEAPTPSRLRETREPVQIYADDPASWGNGPPGDVDRPALQVLGTQLLLPLAVKDKLPGFLSLGPKQSQEPYSPSDLRLLKSVASQTALGLENARLTEAVASEVARRERLNREIEIARDVQQGLFPQHYPAVPGLDYAGTCRPALGVGGDYYDFLALPGGILGIAIGDVSGKGVPAALLMAGLQASLRGQTLSGPADLASLMANVSRLVYEASPPNRYATFFYGQYDPAERRLVYVNAGHNAPMLFRAARPEALPERLEAGGPVVGLLPLAPYHQGSVVFEPGDLLVCFTDGISEAMNGQDEEWGEENLIEAIRAVGKLPADEVMQRLMVAADAFVAGAKQYDDMTLVVMWATQA